MMSTTILHEAEVELWDAVDYYESKQLGLGLDFLQEIESSLDTIQSAPKRWRLREDGTRRYLTHRFPFLVVYLVEEQHLWILAIAHCKQRPNYWKERMPTAEPEAEGDGERSSAP